MNESLDVSAQQTSLMSPLFVDVPIPSQESERSFTCLLVVSTTHKKTNGNDRRNEAEALLAYRVNVKTKQTTTKYTTTSLTNLQHQIYNTDYI
jgi:hypothetical protein